GNPYRLAAAASRRFCKSAPRGRGGSTVTPGAVELARIRCLQFPAASLDYPVNMLATFATLAHVTQTASGDPRYGWLPVLLLLDIIVFVVILLVAYLYAWGKGVFRWD